MPQTFIGNHDVTRIASRLDNPEHVALALVLLMTTGGVPTIYAGDEFGFRGVKENAPAATTWCARSSPLRRCRSTRPAGRCSHYTST